MAISKLSGSAARKLENLGVVQVRRSGEESFVGPKHEDADWWKIVWENSKNVRCIVDLRIRWSKISHNRRGKVRVWRSIKFM